MIPRYISMLLFLFVTVSGFMMKHQSPSHRLFAKLSEADKERLLLSEEGLTAFIVAEMEHFVNTTMVGLDEGTEFGRKWVMPDNERLQMGLIDEEGVVVDEVYNQSREEMKGNEGGSLAVGLICNVTRTAFQDGFREQGLLSALGSAILYFRDYYRTPRLIAACERVGLSDYAVAHHISDMYHHRNFRGTYTKTLPASGKGELAARKAVGLDKEEKKSRSGGNQKPEMKNNKNIAKTNLQLQDDDEEEEDECLVWSPTNPDVCIHWKSDDEKWRKTRFERIQMEGTKDPRRGGSGTTR